MKKNKHIKSSLTPKKKEPSSNKTSESGTFNDLEWDLIDEVDFSHKKFIKVANFDKILVASGGCSTGHQTTGSKGTVTAFCTTGCG